MPNEIQVTEIATESFTLVKCRVCRKKLRSKWRELGIGPVCARRCGIVWIDGVETQTRNHYTVDLFTNDIICTRDPNGRPQVNVYHVWPLHSPDGMEWGYQGSGPSDLALNILIKYGVRRHLADLHHVAFRERFVAGIPESGGVIREDDIRAFLTEKGLD